jgi:hypothetical protein
VRWGACSPAPARGVSPNFGENHKVAQSADQAPDHVHCFMGEFVEGLAAGAHDARGIIGSPQGKMPMTRPRHLSGQHSRLSGHSMVVAFGFSCPRKASIERQVFSMRKAHGIKH